MTDLVAAALSNPINRAILTRLPMLGIEDAWLVAGCIYQAYWNVLRGRPASEGVKDYDIFYFDPTDLSYEAEDAIVQRARLVFADLDALIDLKNQARVHLWYRQRFGADYPPLGSAREAIGRFQIRCTCVGLQPRPDGTLDLHAPYGLDELTRGELKANRHCPDRSGVRAKAESYRARWPWLTIASVDDEAGV
ncbi:nucleotidyltransferase family protein [Dongia sp.]|uniref:nucleotidyltransferase family protein n=1 Tax=Dongia sp. TaxID=1977262 RepID=UPI0035B26DBE